MKKLLKYLETVDREKQTCLDQVLFFYADGKLEKFLSQYELISCDIFPEITSQSKSIQVNFLYYNIIVELEFTEQLIMFNMFEDNSEIDNTEDNLTENEYPDNFDVEHFFKDLFDLLKNEKSVDKTVLETHKAKMTKKKTYRTILGVTALVSALIFIGFVIYANCINKEYTPSRWLALCLIPVLVWIGSVIYGGSNKK